MTTAAYMTDEYTVPPSPTNGLSPRAPLPAPRPQRTRCHHCNCAHCYDLALELPRHPWSCARCYRMCLEKEPADVIVPNCRLCWERWARPAIVYTGPHGPQCADIPDGNVHNMSPDKQAPIEHGLATATPTTDTLSMPTSSAIPSSDARRDGEACLHTVIANPVKLLGTRGASLPGSSGDGVNMTTERASTDDTMHAFKPTSAGYMSIIVDPPKDEHADGDGSNDLPAYGADTSLQGERAEDGVHGPAGPETSTTSRSPPLPSSSLDGASPEMAYRSSRLRDILDATGDFDMASSDSRDNIERANGITLRNNAEYRSWLHARFVTPWFNRPDAADIAYVEVIAGLVEHPWESYEHHIHERGYGEQLRDYTFCEAYRRDGRCNGYELDCASELGKFDSRAPVCSHLHLSREAVAELRRARRHRGWHAARRHWCANFLAGTCGAGRRCPHPHLAAHAVRELARTAFNRAHAGTDAGAEDITEEDKSVRSRSGSGQ